MRRLLIIAMIVVGAMLAASLVVLAVLMPRGPASQSEISGAKSPSTGSPLTPDHTVDGLVIPPFIMRDQDRREVTETVFDGRVTLVDFIFTDCPSICPMMNTVLAELAGRLKGTPVRIVSISVNPERDTPERLKEYGAKFRADFQTWLFLTGDWETAQKIVRDGLGFLLRRDPDTTVEVAGGTTYNVTHPGKLILVGPNREVLTWADYSFENEVAALEDRARRAAAALK